MKYNILFIFIFSLLSCSQKTTPELKTIQGNAIGTTFTIKYLDTNNEDYQSKIDSLINAINKSTSTYIPTSDISRINDGDTTVVVDAYFEEVARQFQLSGQELTHLFWEKCNPSGIWVVILAMGFVQTYFSGYTID